MTEWNEQKIAEMIANGIEENSELDWKQSQSLIDCKKGSDKPRNELAKDVSSFANAGGGVLIYGVSEEPDPPHKPVGFDEGCDVSFSKETIESILLTRIHPKIPDLKIFPVSLDSNKPGKYAYVIEIPQSHTIHQAHDKRYYRRRNFQAEPMEDYEVREGMVRSRSPLIKVELKYKLQTKSQNEHFYNLNIDLENIGSVRARDLMFFIDMPTEILDKQLSFQLHTPHNLENSICIEHFRIKHSSGKDYYRFKIRTLQNLVLFPSEKWILPDLGFQIRYKIDSNIHRSLLGSILDWQVYADDSVPRSGQLLLREIQQF
jgi:hypothetical protein